MIIYLASPYSDPEKSIREIRYRAAEQAMVQMIQAGEHVYSPIVMTHPGATRYSLSQDSSYWRPHNFAFLSVAKELRVLKMKGWEKSKGVKEEIEFAIINDIPISYWIKDKDWILER